MFLHEPGTCIGKYCQHGASLYFTDWKDTHFGNKNTTCSCKWIDFVGPLFFKKSVSCLSGVENPCEIPLY